MSARQVARLGCEIVSLIEANDWPTTERLDFDRPEVAETVLDQLVEHGSVSWRAGVYHLDAQQALQAAYYRNTIVHYFVPGAIAELALAATDTDDPLEDFWKEVARLRDLLKFEFFFADRDDFRAEVCRELDHQVPGWQRDVGSGRARSVLDRIVPLRAHWAVLPFLEAYRVVADELVETIGPVEDQKAFIAAAMERGRRERLTGAVEADESVSKALMQSALSLAANRDLLGSGAEHRRQQFASEVRAVCTRAAEIGRLADLRNQAASV